MVLLSLNILSSIFGIATNAVGLHSFPGILASEDYSDPSELLFMLATGLAGLGMILVLVLTVIAFSVWIHRTNSALGRYRPLTFTPGWAVGWWFVPLANLYKPYQVMVELWRASDADKGADWWLGPRSGVLPAWWAAWLLHGFLGNVVARLSWNVDSEQASETALAASIVSDLVTIPAAALGAWIVWQLQRRVENRLSNAPS